MDLANSEIGLSDVHEMNNVQVMLSGEVITNYSHLTDDGRYLYVISQTRIAPYTVDRIVVDKYDPLQQMNHLSRIILSYDTMNLGNLFTFFILLFHWNDVGFACLSLEVCFLLL